MSFDLFDTLVVRRSATERAVHRRVGFIAAGEGLFDRTVTPERYVELRRVSTERALRASDAPSLCHIHAHVAELLGLDATGSERIMCIEIAQELADLAVVPGAVERLQHVRQAGKHVAITSDMHLGGAVLGPRLRDLGLLTARDTLLVSSDAGVSKSAGGRLFNRLSQITGSPPQRILHYGNDAWTDYAMPRRRGLQAVLDSSAVMNRYEATLAASADPSGLAELFAGASRIVRLRHARQNDGAYNGVICGVAAPTLAAFGIWTASEASRLGVRDLVFLSRNGRLPFEVFSRLGSTITEEFGWQYLRLSRDALRLPSADALGLDRWLEVGQANRGAFLCEFDDRLTLAQSMSRIGLDPELDADALDRHGLDPNRPITKQDRRMWATFLDDDGVRDRLRSEAHRDRRLVVDYLAAHDVSADRPLGVVDIGWTGQQAAMMSACLETGSGDPSLQHFHLGREHSVPLIAPTDIHRFLFDGQDRPVNNPIGLYELFTATTEPGMTGLRRTPDGRVEAELREETNTSSELVDTLHQLVAEFTDELAQNLRPEHLEADLPVVLCSLARTFWFDPTPAEGRVFGGIPWEVDASGHVVRPFAQPIAMRELPGVLRPGGLAGRQWSVGAVAASPWPIRWLLKGLVRRRAHRQLEHV